MARKNISAGSAPLVWSTVDDAFGKINSNFQEIYSTLDANNIDTIDFENLNSNLNPSLNGIYDIGSPAQKWRNLYLSGTSFNLGAASIQSSGAAIALPSGSTVGGELIINPDKPGFKSISVLGQDTVVADTFTDTLTLTAGTAMAITTLNGDDAITFINTGVTQLTGTVGQIGVSSSTGAITLTNLGVTSLTAGSVIAGRAAGLGISVSSATGGVSITNTGVVDIITGTPTALSITTNSLTGILTINNLLPAGNAYRIIAVNGQPTLTARNTGDTITFINGSGVEITNTVAAGAFTNRVTFSNTGVLSITTGKGISASSSTGNITLDFDNNVDIVGSVFGENSTILLNAATRVLTGDVVGNVTGTLLGTVNGILNGDVKGSVFGDDSSVIIDGTNNTVIGTLNGNITRTTDLTITATKISLEGALQHTVQTLGGLATGNITLTAAQITGNILTGDPLVSNRDLNLPSASATVAGYRLIIKNRSASFTITVKDAGASTITTIATSSHAEITCDGFSWFVL